MYSVIEQMQQAISDISVAVEQHLSLGMEVSAETLKQKVQDAEDISRNVEKAMEVLGFPKGFESWKKTFYYLSSHAYVAMQRPEGSTLSLVTDMLGADGVQDQVEQWTTEFEKEFQDELAWEDVDFEEQIATWADNKLTLPAWKGYVENEAQVFLPESEKVMKIKVKPLLGDEDYGVTRIIAGITEGVLPDDNEFVMSFCGWRGYVKEKYGMAVDVMPVYQEKNSVFITSINRGPIDMSQLGEYEIVIDVSNYQKKREA